MTSGSKENCGVPKWLLTCKEEITTSQEWNQYLQGLNDAIKQQLVDSHVPFYTDLTNTGKILFMDKAVQATKEGPHYHSMYNTISSLVDHHLHTSVASLPDGSQNKWDMIVEQAQDGAASLLKRWPVMKSKLCMFFNHPLPKLLRQLVWKHTLSNKQVSIHFVKLCHSDPEKKTLSDPEITENCKKLLSRVNLQDLNGSIGTFHCMRYILAFYQSVSGQTISLNPTDYFLTIPFLLVALQHIPQNKPVPDKVLALLAEEFLTFMSNRPPFLLESDKDLKMFTENVVEILKMKYPSAAQAFRQRCDRLGRKVAGTSDVKDTFIKKMAILLKPVIQNMFVVYFNQETLLYVWDQYMIGSETPGFHNLWLAVVTSISLFYLKNYIKDHQLGLEAIFIENWPKIKMLDIQYEVKNKFHEELNSLLDIDQHKKMTFLDPSHDGAHWQKWYTSTSLQYTQPQDRRCLQETLRAERERTNQQLERNHREMQIQKAQFTNQLQEVVEQSRMEKELLEKDNNSLQERLNQEIESRNDTEKRAAEEKQKLIVELEWLKAQMQKIPYVTTQTPEVIGTEHTDSRPPTEETAVKVPVVSPSPYVQKRRNIVKAFMATLLTTINQSIIPKVSDQGPDYINQRVQNYIKNVKRAELKLFQRRLQPGEICQMSPEKQKETHAKILLEIERYQREEQQNSRETAS